MELLKANFEQLSAYEDALRRGWSPDNLRADVIQEQLAAISKDPVSFVSEFEDLEGAGRDVTLPDGSKVERLPGIKRWIWQDGFCGIIGLRWQRDTEELPVHCAGHVGYSVVPWRRRQGLASSALIALLPIARAIGLRHLDVSTSPDNVPSIRVIEKANGKLIKRFRLPQSLGGEDGLLYRISIPR